MASGFDTAANIISRAARRMSLVSADIADPFGSTDPNILQLCALVTKVGEDLLRAHPWSHLKTPTTIATANGDEDYDLPADYARMVDGTFWNRTQHLPLAGPADAALWQQLKATTADFAVSKVYRVVGDEILIYPIPTAIETLAYEYISRYWVATAGIAAPDAETVTTKTDILWFDRNLLVAALCLEWKGEKGEDTGKAQSDYDQAYAAATGGDGAAPTLNLNVRSPYPFGWIGNGNLPPTGWGS